MVWLSCGEYDERMAKFPGNRGAKAKKRQQKGRITLNFGVASSKYRPPAEDDPVRIRAGKGGITMPDKRTIAYRLALDGYSDEVIARIAGVSVETFKYWRKAHPEFDTAIDEGRTAADAEVIATLFDLATGRTRRVTEIAGKDAVEVTYEKYFPPEISAIKAWLRMRGNKRFKEVPAEIDITSKGKRIGDGLNKESKADIINSIVAAVRPKPDNAPAKSTKTKK